MSSVGSLSYAQKKIHVLYVDHDSNNESLIEEKFAYFSSKVTIVKFAATALQMLSKGKHHFDLLMENIRSPDSYGFILLQDATKMNLPVILLIDEDDPMIIMRGIREGALFCIQKPLTLEQIKYLWQHVLRERICKPKENETLKGLVGPYELLNTTAGQKYNKVGQSSTSVKRARIQRNSNKNDQSGMQNHNFIQPGMNCCIEWTPKLHGIFMDAVKQLGEGRCYPKDILELMNVPGLTRMHVASHLQKCRSGDWQLHNKRKRAIRLDLGTETLHVNNSPVRERRFGTMPSLDTSPKIESKRQENCMKKTNEIHNVDLKIGNSIHGEHSQRSMKKDNSVEGQVELNRQETRGKNTIEVLNDDPAMEKCIQGNCSGEMESVRVQLKDKDSSDAHSVFDQSGSSTTSANKGIDGN